MKYKKQRTFGAKFQLHRHPFINNNPLTIVNPHYMHHVIFLSRRYNKSESSLIHKVCPHISTYKPNRSINNLKDT